MGDGITRVGPGQEANIIKESEPDNSRGGRMVGPGQTLLEPTGMFATYEIIVSEKQ